MKAIRRNFKLLRVKQKLNRGIYCPMCNDYCGKGMGSGYKYMLHFTIGCEQAKRY